jgi:hypothetical protein
MEQKTGEMPRGEMETSTTASTQNMGDVFRATAKEALPEAQGVPEAQAVPTVSSGKMPSDQLREGEPGPSTGKMPGE